MMTPCFNNYDQAFKSHLGTQMRHLQHQSQHMTYTNHNMFPPSSIISAATSAINTHEHIISHCISTVPHHTSFWYYQTRHHCGPVLLCSSTSTVWPFPLVASVPSTLLHTSITSPYERIYFSTCTPILLIQHQTKGLAPYLPDTQAHQCVPCSHLLHISFLQRGIPWPCRLHSNSHSIRRLHSSPISTNLLHVCWPWPYNAEYSHLGSPVSITKTFLFFFFFFFFF